jgi:hypothetical protein
MPRCLRMKAHRLRTRVCSETMLVNVSFVWSIVSFLRPRSVRVSLNDSRVKARSVRVSLNDSRVEARSRRTRHRSPRTKARSTRARHEGPRTKARSTRPSHKGLRVKARSVRARPQQSRTRARSVRPRSRDSLVGASSPPVPTTSSKLTRNRKNRPRRLTNRPQDIVLLSRETKSPIAPDCRRVPSSARSPDSSVDSSSGFGEGRPRLYRSTPCSRRGCATARRATLDAATPCAFSCVRGGRDLLR